MVSVSVFMLASGSCEYIVLLVALGMNPVACVIPERTQSSLQQNRKTVHKQLDHGVLWKTPYEQNCLDWVRQPSKHMKYFVSMVIVESIVIFSNCWDFPTLQRCSRQ